MFWLLMAGQGLLAQHLPQPEVITDRQGLPQGFVPAIVQDREGFIWIATSDGLCRYDGSHFNVFKPDPDGKPALSATGITDLKLDAEGKIWVTSNQLTLDQLDPRQETINNFSRQPFIQRRLGHQLWLSAYLFDQQNQLWMGIRESGGLVNVDTRTNRLRRFRHQPDQSHSLSHDDIKALAKGKDGTIWVATKVGLDRFDARTAQFFHYPLPVPGSLSDKEIWALHVRLNGDLLIGYQHHIVLLEPRTGRVRLYPLSTNSAEWDRIQFATDSRGTTYVELRNHLFRFADENKLHLLAHWTEKWRCKSLLIDRSDVLWVGTDGYGIRKFNLRAGAFQNAPYRTNFHVDLLTQWLGLSPARVPKLPASTSPYTFRYTFDGQGLLWFNLAGQFCYQLNLLTRELRSIAFPTRFHSVDPYHACPLATDPQGSVWAVFDSLTVQYDTRRKQWQPFPFRYRYRIPSVILQLVVDERALWLASLSDGLFRVDRATGQVQHYRHRPGDSTSLSTDHLYCLFRDPADENRLWVGTYGGGLCAFDKRTGRCRRITTKNGLPDDVIYSAIPDHQGYLWVGTNKGLCRIHRQSFQIRHYTHEDGLQANEFNRFHYLHLPNDRIIMGGLEGFTVFDPATIGTDRFEPPVELTALQINNQRVQPGPQSLIGTRPVQTLQTISLPYDQNYVTAEFAVLQYNQRAKNRYRYRLDGLDERWIVSDQPTAVYTSLAPGQYTLRLNASNTSGIWSPHVRQLGITIRPPLWATWWAYLLYVLLSSSLVWYGIRSYLSRLRWQQAADLQQKEAQQLRALDEMKSRFFTNVTHDFRTPLTLILSPMAGLLQELAETPYGKRLASMNRNAQQLLALINQLLDFAKLDAKAMSVENSRGDIAHFVGETLQLFQEEAARKAITLTYHPEVSGDYWFDAGKLERILSNLVANALKFTLPGGQVRVCVQAAEAVMVSVSDTGVGIPSQSLPHLFERFHPVEQAPTRPANPLFPPGTGVGLALVHELVSLQQGHISVESQLGQGTTFHLRLPYQKAEFTHPFAGKSLDVSPGDVEAFASEEDSSQPHILLVEDNAELADFITESLPAPYRISWAVNGQQGVEQARESLPDLIISDVLMPVMDGFTLCEQLKTDVRTNHIPIILLTAKTAVESRLAGLARGADEYLTKPFHVEELRLRVHNLLLAQQRLRERIRQSLSQVSEPALPPAVEDPFLTQLYGVLDRIMAQPELTVDQLAHEMALSRRTLQRKLSMLTGLSINELIRSYRLQKAARLLRGGLPVTEVAYTVGFENLSYFSRCFKDQFEKSPSDFASAPATP